MRWWLSCGLNGTEFTEWHGVHLKDLSMSNLSLTLGQSAHPFLKLCDAGSWYRGKKQSVLPGFWAVVDRFAPARAHWLHSAWKNNKNRKQVLVDLLLPECQNYHSHLLRHQIMNGSLKLQAQWGRGDLSYCCTRVRVLSGFHPGVCSLSSDQF